MKKYNIFYGVAVILTTVTLYSCTSENPFESYGSGEGTVSFATEFHSDVVLNTRADINSESLDKLKEKMLIYIERDGGSESNRGVIRKYEGYDALPKSLTLAVGNYYIDGWTGDSVSASFTEKFYRGKQAFTVVEGNNSDITFKMNIANVIVTIDANDVDEEFKDLKVKVNHTRGSLDFDRAKIDEGTKGYFMMPSSDADLNYTIEVTSENGELKTYEGTISDVQRAHQYTLKISANEPDHTLGGALIQVQIQEINVLDETYEIFPAPAFKAFYGTEEIDLNKEQINCTEIFNDLTLRVVAYGGLSNLSLEFNSQFEGNTSAINDVNLRDNGVNSNALNALEGMGITYVAQPDTNIPNNGSKDGIITVHEGWFTFKDSFFQNLDETKENEYSIVIKATDRRTYSKSITVRIARNPKAVENNLVGSEEAPGVNDAISPMAILATSAELTGIVYSDEATNYGIEYRKNGTQDEFVKVYADDTNILSRASETKTFVVNIKGLNPGTTYEYKAFATSSDGTYFEEKSSRTFQTESNYSIPNSNMNSWSTNNKGAYIPGEGGSATFWDSGNHGSITLKVNLTQQDTSFESGNSVAKLRSQFVDLFGIGKFGAGNLFTGSYVRTNGTNGVLQFGREYNESHPSALKVKVNYNPGVATKNTYNNDYIKQGETDKGQIYIALTTTPIDIETSDDLSTAKLFNKNAKEVIAYNEHTFDSKTDSGGLVNVEIPFIYNERALTNSPKYIIIVCSASKYGDYFCGGEGSTMYVDDFELEYGDITFE